MKGRADMNKTWLMVLLAVLLGIACGALHAKSVAEHKASVVHSEPTHYIEQTESKEMPISADVKVIHKADDPDIPDVIEEACITYGKQYGISVEFLEALIWQESRMQNSTRVILRVFQSWEWIMKSPFRAAEVHPISAMYHRKFPVSILILQ